MSTFWLATEGISALGYKDQADYTAGETGALSGFTWLQCGPPKIGLTREMLDRSEANSGTVGAPVTPKAGRKGGTLEFTCYLRSQSSSWTPSSGPTAPPEFDLLEEIVGAGSVGSYQAAAVENPITGSNAKTIILAAGSADEGEAYIVGTDSARTAIGVVKDVSGSTVTLREDSDDTPDAGDNLYPLRTVYPTNAQPTPKSFRFVGDTADQDIVLVGCMPTGAKVEFGVGGLVTATLSYRFTDWTMPGAGAAQDVADYMDIPPALGVNGARVTLAGGSTGTADGTGTCGVDGLTFEVALEGAPILCHGADQGESAYEVTRRTFKATAKIPHTSARVSGGKTIFDTSLEADSGSLSLLAFVGTRPGATMLVNIPAGKVVEQHSFEVADGVVVYGITLQADSYSGDTDGSPAANAPFCLAFG